MIEAKIFLLMFVWPEGQAEDPPRWTSDAYLTFVSCEENAVKRKANIVMEYGSGTRIEQYCVHADDRMDK